jgi:ATP-dependent RNA helicase RhlE
VIQFDPPDDREGYVHRVGRTGRAGRTGIGITFVGAEQAKDMAKIAGELQLSREFERSGFQSNSTAGSGPKPQQARPQQGEGGAPRRNRRRRGGQRSRAQS